MTNSFNHFIITRFNLKQSIWEKDKMGYNVNNNDWLENRYALFETYCFSSMIHQTLKNFKWLVYFDTNTPLIYKEKNKSLQLKLPNFTPIYVSSFLDFEKELPNDIEQYCSEQCDFILTTRLDNDDCFHKQAVHVIQQHFKPIDKAIIDLKNGLVLKVFEDHKLALKKETTSGPFITLIERYTSSNKPLTVYNREHLQWIGTATFIDVTMDYYWLQIIHKRNISNILKGELTFNKKFLKGFEFDTIVKFKFKYYMFIILKKIKHFLLSRADVLKQQTI